MLSTKYRKNKRIKNSWIDEKGFVVKSPDVRNKKNIFHLKKGKLFNIKEDKKGHFKELKACDAKRKEVNNVVRKETCTFKGQRENALR